MVSGMRKSKNLIDELVAVNDCSRKLFPLKVMHHEMIGSKGKRRLFFFIFFHREIIKYQGKKKL